eukprot:scaffold13705_cov70-Phaeocystis_antarctica.AAC.1
MSHHNAVRHVSARLHIYRFRPWAPVGCRECASHQRLRQPDSALRALLLACRLELRHACLRASRATV